MGSKEAIEEIKPQKEFYTCPGCSYKDGFHVSFQRDGKKSDYKIVLICPQCHKRYTIGWTINFNG
jgi:hypothetical protein